MIEGVKIKDLKVFPDDRGVLMEMWRSDDPDFRAFGQCYITSAHPGVVKAWHHHEKQTDHWVCLVGSAKVGLYDGREGSPTFGEKQTVYLGDAAPRLLIIPAGVEHGFTPCGNESCTVLNIPDRLYDYDNPDELRRPWDDPEIGFEWGVKNG
ncbi:MAG TPA: dTDP-4-dehydrorhamnose 3,5-epimerase family protein [Coriobacteriia bacterium]